MNHAQLLAVLLLLSLLSLLPLAGSKRSRCVRQWIPKPSQSSNWQRVRRLETKHPYLPDTSMCYSILALGSKVRLVLKYVDIKPSVNCTKDALYLCYNFKSSCYKLCGRNAIVPNMFVQSSKGSFIVKFYSSSAKNTNYKGFVIDVMIKENVNTISFPAADVAPCGLPKLTKVDCSELDVIDGATDCAISNHGITNNDLLTAPGKPFKRFKGDCKGIGQKGQRPSKRSDDSVDYRYSRKVKGARNLRMRPSVYQKHSSNSLRGRTLGPSGPPRNRISSTHFVTSPFRPPAHQASSHLNNDKDKGDTGQPGPGFFPTCEGVPWQALLTVKGSKGDPLCGGVLIARTWILTAAHCLDGLNEMQLIIKLGIHHREKSKGQEFQIAGLSRPDSYNSDSSNPFDKDIMLIKLDKEAEYGETVWPICMPPLNSYLTPPAICIVSGWGINHHSDYPMKLGFGEVEVISQEDCNQGYKYIPITDNMICARGKREKSGKPIEVCAGDSGGPLATVNNDGLYELRGIVSFGPENCVQEGKYGVYTRVTQYLDWIKMIID